MQKKRHQRSCGPTSRTLLSGIVVFRSHSSVLLSCCCAFASVALKKLLALADKIKADPAAAKQLAELLYTYKEVFESHASYEDGILFAAMDEYFPGLIEVTHHDHMRDTLHFEVCLHFFTDQPC
jgi:hypothetical protein